MYIGIVYLAIKRCLAAAGLSLMEHHFEWRKSKEALVHAPGWFFLLLALIFFLVFGAANVVFGFHMGPVELSVVIVLTTLFIWVLLVEVGPEPAPEQIEAYKKEHPHRYEKNYGRTRLAGVVGGVLFTILGYEVALKIHADPDRVEHLLNEANYRAFGTLMACAWVPYLIFRLRSWWQRRKLERLLAIEDTEKPRY